jgi:hypothetical protein
MGAQMNHRLPVIATLAVSLTSVLLGCGEARYAAFEVTLEEAPGEKFLLSAGDATISSPIFVSIEGREPTVADKRYRMQVEKRWVAAHVPEGATFAYYGSAECKVTRREGEFPGCEIIAIEVPAKHETIAYHFYVGNWPFE